MSDSENSCISKIEMNKEFHEGIGGNKRIDLRFYTKPEAMETRNLINQIYDKRKAEISLEKLAEEIGVDSGTLSLAIGGRAGNKKQEKFNGLSSTDYVVQKLKEILGSDGQEYNI